MRLGLVLLLAASVAHASPRCLTEFASLAPFYMANEGEQLDLVSGTYKQLLETLGATVSAETLKTMVETQSPFDIPEQKDTDLLTLRRRVKELEAMVAEKRWNTPATVSRLLTDLQERIDRMGRAQITAEAAQADAASDTFVELDSALDVQLSPDGRYLFTKNAGSTPAPPGRWKQFGTVYDVKAGKSWHVEGPSEGYLDPVFNSDGTALIFRNGNGVLNRVPFHDGKLDWSNDASIGTNLGELQWPHTVAAGGSPEVAYGALNKSGEFFRYDLKSRKRIPLEKDGMRFKTPSLQSFTVIPGTNDLAVMTPSLTGLCSVRYAVSTEGKATQIELREFYVSTIRNVVWHSDGRAIGFDPWGKVLLYSKKGVDAPIDLYPKLDPAFTSEVADIKFDPANGDLLVLARREHEQFRVTRFDAGTMEIKGAFDLKGHHVSMRITADGKRIILPTGKGGVRILNPDSRQ